MNVPVTIDLIVRTLGLQAGLKQANASFGKFAESIKGQIASAIGVGAIVAMSRRTMEFASSIKNMASELEISTTELQKMGYAAEDTGGSIEDVVAAMRTLNNSRIGVLKDPASEDALTFQKHGITRNDLNTKSVDELYVQLARSIENAKNPQVALNEAISLMGKSAARVFPSMRQGLEELAKGSEDAGRIIDDKVIAKLDTWGNRISAAFSGFRKAFADALVTTVEGNAGWFDKMTKMFVEAKAYATYMTFGFGHKQSSNYALAEGADYMKKRGYESKETDEAGGKSNKFEPPKLTTTSSEAFHLTANQQAGAYSGVGFFVGFNPLLQEAIRSTGVQEEIAKNTKAVEEGVRELVSRASGGVFY